MLSYKALALSVPSTFRNSSLNFMKILTLKAFQWQEIKDYTTIVKTARRLGRRGGPFFWLVFNIQLNKVVHVLLSIFGKNNLPGFLTWKSNRSKTYQHDGQG